MEEVFAVPAISVDKFIPKGLVKGNEAGLLSFAAREGRFHPRTPQLEEDPTLRQLVAYVLVSYEGKLLMYQRAPSGDKRLQKKFSLAFGGHVNSLDNQSHNNNSDNNEKRNVVINGRNRELTEEITLNETPNFSFLGTLNINRAPIDRFHLGFVYRAEVFSPQYKLNEPESFAWSNWSTPEEIVQKFELLESWSQEVFSVLYPNFLSKEQSSLLNS